MRHPQEWLAPLAILILAFAVRAIGLDAQSFWYDEGYSVMFVRREPAAIVSDAARLELNTPLHYLALHGWTRLAGDSEFSSRLLSVFAGVLAVALAAPLASAAGRKARARGLILSMALAAAWPVSVAASQEARMYALATLFCLASVVILLARCFTRGRATDWAAWAAAGLLAFSAHMLAVFLIAAQGVVALAWWLGQRPRRRAPIAALVAVAACIGAWGAWLASFQVDYGTTYADRLNPVDTLVRSLAAQALPRLEPASLIAPAAALALAVAALALALGPRRVRELAAISLIGVAGIAVLCVFTGKFAGRYAAIAAPLFVSMLGLGLARLELLITPYGLRWAARLAGAAALTACAIGLLGLRADPRYANEDFRGAAAYLRRHASLDEPIVLVSGHLAPVFAYYFGDRGWAAVPDDAVLDVRHVLDYDQAVPPLNRALAGRSGAWLLEWQNLVIDPTRLVPELLRRQSRGRWHEPDPPGFHGLGLRHYHFVQPYQPLPEPRPRLESRVERVEGEERGLDAIGCHQFALPRSGDATMEIACFWRLALVSGLSTDTRVSLRLVDEAGAWRTQADVYLAAPYALPNTRIDKSLAAFYQLELPPDLPPGEYALHAVPYFRESLDPPRTREISPRVFTTVEVLPAR